MWYVQLIIPSAWHIPSKYQRGIQKVWADLEKAPTRPTKEKDFKHFIKACSITYYQQHRENYAETGLDLEVQRVTWDWLAKFVQDTSSMPEWTGTGRKSNTETDKTIKSIPMKKKQLRRLIKRWLKTET